MSQKYVCPYKNDDGGLCGYKSKRQSLDKEFMLHVVVKHCEIDFVEESEKDSRIVLKTVLTNGRVKYSFEEEIRAWVNYKPGQPGPGAEYDWGCRSDPILIPRRWRIFQPTTLYGMKMTWYECPRHQGLSYLHPQNARDKKNWKKFVREECNKFCIENIKTVEGNIFIRLLGTIL